MSKREDIARMLRNLADFLDAEQPPDVACDELFSEVVHVVQAATAASLQRQMSARSESDPRSFAFDDNSRPSSASDDLKTSTNDPGVWIRQVGAPT